MAIKFCDVVNYNKQGSTKRGQRAQGKIAGHARYITREPTLRHEQSAGEHAAHVVRARASEAPRTRQDVVAVGHRDMPDFATAHPLQYWAMADQHAARKDAHLGKEVVLLLPREFSREQNQALLADFLARHIPANHPTTWAFHEPHARNGRDLHPHAHILVSPKVTDATSRHLDPATYFRPQHRGGAPHEKPWDGAEKVRTLQAQWEQTLRQALRAHQLEHALTRTHRDTEVRHPWQGMRQMRRLLKEDYGHEHRIAPQQIADWVASKRLTEAQAAWVVQRADRQLTWQHTLAQAQVHRLQAHARTLSPWQLKARWGTASALKETTRTLTTLGERRQALQPLYTQLVGPAQAKQQAAQMARYQQRLAHERAVQRQRAQQDQSHTVRQTPRQSMGMGRGW